MVSFSHFHQRAAMSVFNKQNFISNQKTENNNIKVILYLPTMPWQFKSAHTFAISYFIWCITIINVSIILYVLALCVCVWARACVCVLVVFLIWTGWDCANITLRLLLGISFVLWLFRTDIIIIIIFTLLRQILRNVNRQDYAKKSTTVDSWLFAEFHNSIAAAFLLCESIEMFIISDTLQGNCTIDV